MELPPEINELIQTHLGQRALDTQAELGRGAWIAQDVNGGQASFVPLGKLPELFGGGSASDFALLLKEVAMFDLAHQVVIVFNINADLQTIAIVDIE